MVIDWNAWNFFRFEFLEAPQSPMPYVIVGRRICLYINNLLSKDILERSRGLSLWSLKLNEVLFSLMWFAQVSLLSRRKPSYLIESFMGIFWLLR